MMSVMSPTGRHVTAAEALRLGIVDQVTDHNTVEEAVKFALRVAGETRNIVCTRHSVAQNTLSLEWFKN